MWPNARMLDLALAADFRTSGVKVRVAPPMRVFSLWVENLAVTIALLDGQPVPGTASGLQQEQAWMEAISMPDDVRNSGLRLLARQAQAADRLLHHWFTPDDLPWLDSRFLAWRQAVSASLARQNFFTPEQWLRQLILQLKSSQRAPVRLPERIAFRGFVEFTRLEQDLFEALTGRGVVVRVEVEPREPAADNGDAPQPQLRTYPSPEEELRAAAEWAAHCLQRQVPGIALVIPDLENRAAEVTRALDRALHPRDGLQVAFSGESSYHLAVGVPLADHPLIADALMLLRFSWHGVGHGHGFPLVSRLILSAVLQGAVAERHARAVFESLLREEGRHCLSLHDLKRLIERRRLQHELPLLHGLLSDPPRLSLGADSAEASLACLAAWGWPGPAAAGTLGQVRIDRFVGVLEDLRVRIERPAQAWLDLLQQACREAHVGERGGPLSPVQVLSPADAVGQHFDAARVLDLHADNWPGSPASNAFLPAHAAHIIPRTSPEGMLAYSRTLQRHLECLAPEVTFTYAFKAGDAPRLASPLVAAACAPRAGSLSDRHAETQDSTQASTQARTQAATSTAPRIEPWAALRAGEPPLDGYFNHPWLQAFDDTQGWPLDHGGNNRIAGGASMLKLQASCPLQAYLTYRMNGRFEDMPGPFPDYAWRGNVLHTALFHLYQAHKGRAGAPDAAGIGAAVETAMEQCRAQYRLSAAAREAERSRLQRVLQEWLAVDRQRPQFTVLETEQQGEFEYRGFTLQVRNDRIDQLGDGSRLLIDYKSGTVSVADWKKERNLQPQLPLYALLLQGKGEGEGAFVLGGLALASVRPGECKYVGTSRHPVVEFAGVKAPGSSKSSSAQRDSEWTALTTQWSKGVDLLLQEIISGEAANRLFSGKALDYSKLAAALRRSEGEAWLSAHGVSAGPGDSGLGEGDD